MMSKDSFDLTPEVFRTLAESSVDAIAIGDLEGKQVYGNRACYDMFGYDYEKGEMMGPPLTSLWPEENISILIGEVLPQAMAGGWSGEVRQKRKDDSLFDAYLMAFGLTDETGNLMSAVAIILRDITERKRAEEALAHERYLLNTLMDNVPDAIYFKDADSRLIKNSKAHANAFGLSDPAQAVGKTDFDFFTEEHAQQAYADEQEVMRSGQPLVNIEEKETWPDGRETWASTTKMPMRDEEGKIIGTFGISRDITERKRAEEALAEERNLLRTLIDNLPDLIYVKDTESRFIIGNVALGRLMGATTPDELVGKTDFDFYPQELAAQYYADDQEIIRSGQPLINREEPLMDQITNRRGWLLTTKVPLRDSEGKIVGFVGIGRDITERKRAEEALRRERQQQEIIETQRQALRELSTPIVPVMEGVLVLPLVGSIDTRRAQQVMETLLEAIGRYQAEVVIIDITGVLVVDTGVANHLLQVTRAAVLLGSECVLVGISPEVAQTIVSLGVDLSSIVTQANLQSGIEHALKKTGRRIVNG